MPGFVLIGLPAQESSNPLLMPLAGHEMGHIVWDAENYSKQLSDLLLDQVVNEIIKKWAQFREVDKEIDKGITQKDVENRNPGLFGG